MNTINMILQFVSSGSCAEERISKHTIISKRSRIRSELVLYLMHILMVCSLPLTSSLFYHLCTTSWWNKLQYHIYSIHQLLMSFGYNLTFVICSVPSYCIWLFIPCSCAISSFDFDVCWHISLCFIDCVIPIWNLHANSYGIGLWYAASCTSAVCVVCNSVWCTMSPRLRARFFERLNGGYLT